MRRLLFVFALSSIILLFTSCEESRIRQGRKAYKEYLMQVLKDPKSLIIHNEKFTKEDDNSVDWILDVGAKNGYGGMVRKEYKITTYKGSRVLFIQGEGPYSLDEKK